MTLIPHSHLWIDQLNRKLTRKYKLKMIQWTVDIDRIFHPKTMKLTFFSSAHRTISRTDHILDGQDLSAVE